MEGNAGSGPQRLLCDCVRLRGELDDTPDSPLDGSHLAQTEARTVENRDCRRFIEAHYIRNLDQSRCRCLGLARAPRSDRYQDKARHKATSHRL